MQIKIDGKIMELEGNVTMEQLKAKLRKPHKCARCGYKACLGGRTLSNSIITNAIKASNGLYVIECLNYQPAPEEPTVDLSKEEQMSIISGTEYNLLDPKVKHAFIC